MIGSGREGSACRGERTAADTMADDCAEGFLQELDEVLWLLEESERGQENGFRHATRKSDHLAEFRRLLFRLHTVLVRWEGEMAAGP